MKTKTVYKELTRDDAIELLRANNWRPVSGIVVRDDPSEKWQEPRELHGLIAGDSPFKTNLACWNHAALAKEEIEWEVGDTVEVIRCSESHQFETGVKGIVVEVNGDGHPVVQQTSPTPEGYWKCPVNANDLKPWTSDIKRAYTLGYLRGHNDTVEGQFSPPDEWSEEDWVAVELPKSNSEEGFNFDDAIKIAKGCLVYGEGYRAQEELLEAFHHGVNTVIKALKNARESGLSDTQIRALHRMGSTDQQDNADLTAADLLEAINATQRCLGFLQSIAQGGEDWTAQAQQAYDKACAIIDAAIAKAKGGAQ